MRAKNFFFRPSTTKNKIWILTKTFLQTIVFWTVFLYLIPTGIKTLEGLFHFQGFQPLQEPGWVLFLMFSTLGIYSGYTMSWAGGGTPLPLDCPNQLVIRGPYKLVRNPMAVAGIGQAICVGLILGSYWVILYALIGAVLWHLIVRPIEEKDLENRFGNSYLDYRQNTKCWIPRID